MQLAIRVASEVVLGVVFEQIDQEQLDLCIEARNLCGVVWSIIFNQQHPNPKKDEWIQAGLRWFRKRENFSV